MDRARWGRRVREGFLQKKHPELFTDEDVTVKIDPDELKMVIQGRPRVRLPDQDDRAGFLHEESSVMAKMAQEVGFAKQAHVLLDGTGNSSLTKLTRKLDEGRKAGYTVNGVYVSVPTQLAWARNVKRGKTSNERGGRPVGGVQRCTRRSARSPRTPTACTTVSRCSTWPGRVTRS